MSNNSWTGRTICDICNMQLKNTIVRTTYDQYSQILNKSWEKDVSYLDSLQSSGGLGDTLWHIEAFGGTDFGIDQPLLEVSKSCTEPLLQQALLILTLPGCTKTETGGKRKEKDRKVEIHPEKRTKKEKDYKPRKCLLSTTHVLIKTKRIHVQMLRYCTYCPHIMGEEEKGKPGTWAGMRNCQVEKWQSGWSGRNERWGKAGEWGMVVRGDCVGGGWEATYE